MPDIDVARLVVGAHQTSAVTSRTRQPAEVALEMASDARHVTEVLGRMDGSSVFVATVQDVFLEKTSNRLIVDVQAPNEDTSEQLRSDRLETRHGRLMRERLLRMRGHRVVIWKELEEAGPGKKVRIVVWIEPADVKVEVSSDNITRTSEPELNKPRAQPPAEPNRGPGPTDNSPMHPKAFHERLTAVGASWVDLVRDMSTFARENDLVAPGRMADLHPDRCHARVLQFVDGWLADREQAAA